MIGRPYQGDRARRSPLSRFPASFSQSFCQIWAPPILFGRGTEEFKLDQYFSNFPPCLDLVWHHKDLNLQVDSSSLNPSKVASGFFLQPITDCGIHLFGARDLEQFDLELEFNQE